MATLGGAKALAMEHRIGSLEVGKEADIIAINLGGIEHQPIYSALSQLVYSNCGSKVTHSWIKGQCVLRDHYPQHLDLRDISLRAQYWRDKICPPEQDTKV
jgi:5-methylthioadenosine/S-adenosylhomocysteine deaminase